MRVDILHLYCCRALFLYIAVYMSFHVSTCWNCCLPVLHDATHYLTSFPPAAVVARELFCGYYVAFAWSARVDELLYSCTKISAACTYVVVLSTRCATHDMVGHCNDTACVVLLFVGRDNVCQANRRTALEG